jgi:hypothetical protein
MTDPAILHSMLLVAAAMALLFAAVHDVAVRTVPNRVSLIVAAAGLGLNALDGQFVPALFGGGLVFAGCWYCWRRGWIGGGDVKPSPGRCWRCFIWPSAWPSRDCCPAVQRHGRPACSGASGAPSGVGSAAAFRCPMPAQSPRACC